MIKNEFKAGPSEVETPAQKVTRVLEELKGKIEKAEAIKTTELTFRHLHSATKQELTTRKQTLKDAAFSFLQQVVSLEGMELTNDQRNELNRLREAAKNYDKYFEKTFQEAIDTKEGYLEFVTPKLSEIELSTSHGRTQPTE